MARTAEPARARAGGISFELERFELDGGNRLELRGRWSGVRGLRFVRPTLMLVTSSGRSRSLAVLEHKPWVPEEGETWEAAFPHDEHAEVLKAELAVTPAITIPLPTPGTAANGSPIAALPVRPRSRVQRGKPDRKPDQANETKAIQADAEQQVEAMRVDAELLREQLAAAEEARRAAQDELRQARAEVEGAIARRDGAMSRFEEAVRERGTLTHERDEARTEQARLRGERDLALSERDAARAERDLMVSERDRAFSEREAAISARGAAMVMRGAERVRPQDDRERLTHRLIAIALLGAVTIALLILLHVL